MVEKNSHHLPLDEENVLDFEVAKDLTIEEAVKKQKEIEAGVTEDDGLLDRYIKQHREEIESQKFETQIHSEPLLKTIENDVENKTETTNSILTEKSEEVENHPLLFSEDDTAEYQREVLDEIPVVSTISNIETNGVLEDKGFELAQEDENQVDLSAKKQRKTRQRRNKGKTIIYVWL